MAIALLFSTFTCWWRRILLLHLLTLLRVALLHLLRLLLMALLDLLPSGLVGMLPIQLLVLLLLLLLEFLPLLVLLGNHLVLLLLEFPVLLGISRVGIRALNRWKFPGMATVRSASLGATCISRMSRGRAIGGGTIFAASLSRLHDIMSLEISRPCGSGHGRFAVIGGGA